MENLSPELRAGFTRLDESTQEDWNIIMRHNERFSAALPDRILAHLDLLRGDYSGFPVTRYEHSLQTATMCHQAGKDEEYIVCALLHDIGDTLGCYNHADVAAALLKPFVSDENHWIIEHHAIFQGQYFFHHLGLDPKLREQFRGHPHFEACAEFCSFDQAAFDPGFDFHAGRSIRADGAASFLAAKKLDLSGGRAMTGPVPSLRHTNMQLRRDRILDGARGLLAERGYEGFSNNDLCKAAGVTAPTLYNLIGSKNDILIALMNKSTDELEQSLTGNDDLAALAFIEGIAIEAAKLAANDGSFFRASVIALDQISEPQARDSAERQISERRVAVAVRGCIKALDEGLLRGDIPSADLGTQMYAVFSRPWREWAYGRMTISEFKRQVLLGFYMCLCSDASPDFLKTLRRKISEQKGAKAGPAARTRIT